jgi:hypothetical protein
MKTSALVSQERRTPPAPFLAPTCTRPRNRPEDQLPEAWQPPHDVHETRPLLPGDVVRTVRGYSVHCIDGEDYLSTSTVLSLMRWGDVSHVDPWALEYGRMRGAYVDQACRCHDAGCLDWHALDPKLQPYVEAWSLFKVKEPWVTLETEALITNPWSRTFGYRDRVGKFEGRPVVLDLKTSDFIGASFYLQLASYLGGPRERACAVQLQKDGGYTLHWLPQPMTWRRRFEALAWEAHALLAEEEAREAFYKDRRKKEP